MLPEDTEALHPDHLGSSLSLCQAGRLGRAPGRTETELKGVFFSQGYEKLIHRGTPVLQLPIGRPMLVAGEVHNPHPHFRLPQHGREKPSSPELLLISNLDKAI
jgi:hypothetical protein